MASNAENVFIWWRHHVYGIVINPCTADPGYWKNYGDYILTINASLLLHEELSSATISYDARY